MRTDELSSHLLGSLQRPCFWHHKRQHLQPSFCCRAGDVDHKFGEGSSYWTVWYYTWPMPATKPTEETPDDPSQNHISIYEVGEQIGQRSTDYYHFQNLRTKSELLAESVFTPSFDSVEYEQIDGEDTTLTKKIPPLSIQLSDANLVNAAYRSRHLLYMTIRSLVPGGVCRPCISLRLINTCQLPKGSLMNINFRSDDTKIILYYYQ
jgi:hypothetical protein